MATTLNRINTDLFFAQRTQVNETGDSGDWWVWASATMSDTMFNGHVGNYNDNEDAADDELLIGTKPDTTTFPISSAPSHPRPHPK